MNTPQGAATARGLVVLLGCFVMLQPSSTDLYLASMSVLAAGPIVGPILGAAFEVRFGHQAAFLALAAFAGVLLVVTLGRLTETNRHRSPTAKRPGRLIANDVHVLRSREFTAFAVLGIASYAGLFAFIAGSPFVLIRVLGVPVA